MEVRAILIILVVLANHATISYEVHEVKRISTYGAVCNKQEGAL